MLKAFGKIPTRADVSGFPPSARLREGVFSNIEPTLVMREGASYFDLLREAMSRPGNTAPPSVLPSERVDLHALKDDEPSIVWFGHSSYLISHRGFRVLVDPVLFGNSSPVSFFGKPFPVSHPYSPEDIPPIDLLVLSHDHYDHLDFVTLGLLRNRIARVVCPLGVSSHLRYWGFDSSIISELPWHEQHQVTADVQLTALPARHFSGRLLTRNHTQWSSYALRLRDCNIFIGGDSGYDQQFAMIGSTYGPFDIVMLECGQYGQYWPNIHMFPEETARAASDLKARQLLPVHWGKFVLANHSWNDSIERVSAAAKQFDFDLLTPAIGASSTIGVRNVSRAWWKELAAG
jgi:L-ascorbate metabolism protein UlaG (beta-lactamase superfamily)